MSDLSTQNDGFLGWDDEIDEDGQEFHLFEPGNYDFEVKKFEKGISKTDGAPMAILTIAITDGTYVNTVTERIPLKQSVKWKIASFFRSVGMKKHGETCKMDWPGSIGKKGRCAVVQETYKKKNGDDGTINRIDKFFDPVTDGDDDVPW